VNTNEPDLSSCLTKAGIFHEKNPAKDVRISYESTPVDYNSEEKYI
jgi:hypothetical protein